MDSEESYAERAERAERVARRARVRILLRDLERSVVGLYRLGYDQEGARIELVIRELRAAVSK